MRKARRRLGEIGVISITDAMISRGQPIASTGAAQPNSIVWTNNPSTVPLPACRQKSGVDILYGMPSEAAFAMAEQREIALGSCCIDLDGPERKCAACGHEWHVKRRITGNLLLPCETESRANVTN